MRRFNQKQRVRVGDKWATVYGLMVLEEDLAPRWFIKFFLTYEKVESLKFANCEQRLFLYND